jgi:alginate O-acetyltransferase complex protein AlgI
MLFNSLDFIQFFLLFYVGYLFLQRSYKLQNVLLLAASLFFYAYWDLIFLGLLLLTVFVDFSIGLLISRTSNIVRRRALLGFSLLANLSVLFTFKYFNFFADSFSRFIQLFGFMATFPTLHFVLPLGISFYTFQSMSYTIDVYRGEIKATKSLLDFALYVCFFPQLVAGPIERAGSLLDQVSRPRTTTPGQTEAGIYLILWGYFKKVVVADNLASIADPIFSRPIDFHGLSILLGVIAFTFQIYTDFSGYSDIARGLSKIMGFDLMVNFNLPYFATNPREFWSRWHISLSTWFRDYLYIPLGGNRLGRSRTYVNLLITMLIAGLWHGAQWTFVAWGLFHGLLLTAHRFFTDGQVAERRSSKATLCMKALLMFSAAATAWIFFRAPTLRQAAQIFSRLRLTPDALTDPMAIKLALLILPIVTLELYQFAKSDQLALTKTNYWTRVGFYSGLLVALILFGNRRYHQFIYFNF